MLIEAVPRERLSDDLQAVYDMAVERVGDTDFIQAGANAPELLDWYFNSFYAKVFYGGRVPARTKEIVRLRLSKTHGCAFCNKWNSVDARDHGVTDDEIDALVPWPEDIDAASFSPSERAALRYADQMVLQNMDGYLDSELYAQLKEHYDDAEIFELGMAMAVLTGMAKFLFIADLVPKETNCPIPQRT